MALEEVVGLIRGEPGSRVKLIVEPAGGGDRREVELERQPLNPPAPEADDNEDDDDEDEADEDE